MAEFPALPLFTDTLIADTAYLTDEEFGAYLRIMILQWRTAGCKLPADAAWHMRRLGIDESKYNSLYRPLIDEFFTSDGNFIYQARLLREIEFLREQSRKQSARAKSRWNKDKGVSHGSTTSGNALTLTPKVIKKDDSLRSSSKKVSLNELSVDHISEWLTRKRAEGKYLNHDEYFVLEQFKNYCESKGKRYANYVAAYRNAFEWGRCKPKEGSGRESAHETFGKAWESVARGDT